MTTVMTLFWKQQPAIRLLSPEPTTLEFEEQRPFPQRTVPLQPLPPVCEPAEPFVPLKILYLTDLPESPYRLRRALAVFAEAVEDGWLVFREDLDIYGHGATLDEALQDFAESLLDNYDIYALADEEQLTEGARQLAKQLREVLELR